MNQLFFGDNLNVLREHIKDESVDLIYLDPPFNSKRDYNLLFKTPKSVAAVYDGRGDQGKGEDSAVADRRYSEAQITAFDHLRLGADQADGQILSRHQGNRQRFGQA
jgi:DNA modification methylase